MPQTKPNSRLQAALLSCLLFLATLCLYSPVLDFQFLNFDDNEYVTENQYVNSGLTTANVRWAFTQNHSGHWHPLSWISHMLDVELFGFNPGAHHAVNVVFHAFNGVLAFLLLLSLTGALWPSFLVAALFVAHPMRLESVAWISERKDVLSVFWGLVAFNFYTWYARRGGLLRYGAFFGAFILSLLAKPTLVTLPVLCCLLDFWPLRRLDKNRAGLVGAEKIPLLLACMVVSYLAWQAQAAAGGLKDVAAVALSERVATVLVGYLAYLGKLFFPTGLGVFYPLISYPPGVAAGAFVALMVISVIVARAAIHQPYLLFGWCWFLVSLLPMVGFVAIGGQVFADRWTYVPHFGLLIAVVWWAREMVARFSVRGSQLVSGGCVIAALVVTRSVLPVWANSETLFRHTLAVSPNNFMAHTNLGTALDIAGKLDEAGIHFSQAHRLNPTYPPALNNLGSFKARKGELGAARELFEQAVSIQPGFLQARYNLGLTWNNLGFPERGLVEWLGILYAAPDHPAALQSVRFVLTNNFERICAEAGAGRVALKGPVADILVRMGDSSDVGRQLSQLSRCW